MSSLRGSPPARASAPVRSHRAPAPLSLVLLLYAAGCSSAATGGEGQSGTEGAATTGAVSGDTGWSSGAVGGGESTSDPSGGTGGTGEGTSGTATSGDEPPGPMDEPVPADQYDPLNETADGVCAVDEPIAWRVAARDADAMTSPGHAREAMLGAWPSLSGVAIQPWEFLNYYTFAYPLAPPGQLMAAAQLQAGKDDLGDMFELQLAIRGPELSDTERPSVHLTLALDNSQSIKGKALELIKATGHAIAGRLRVGDTVAVVSWNAVDSLVLPPTPVSGPNDPKLLAAIDGFVVGGAAELKQALAAAYPLAEQTYVGKDINRVIVVSDGGATATEDDLAEIAMRVAAGSPSPGLHTIGIGVGDPALYRRDLIDAVAEAGAGASLYIGSPAEAEAQLGARFLGVVALTAAEVEIRLTLPPGLQLETAGPSGVEVDVQDRVFVAATDRAVIHRRLRPCVQDLDPQGLVRVDVSWVDAQSGEVKQTSAEWKLSALLSGETTWLRKGEAVLAYAAALQAIQHYPGDTGAFEEAFARLAAAKASLPNDPELAEIGQVLAALYEP